MDDINEPVVYKPKIDETRKEYLQRYTDDEIHRITKDILKLKEFITILTETTWPDNIFKRFMNECYRGYGSALLSKDANISFSGEAINLWADKRQEVLRQITEFETEIEATTTRSSTLRITGYTLDALCTAVASLNFKIYKYLSLTALPALFGLRISTIIIEKMIVKDEINKLLALLKEDQILFAPIEKWYHQCETFENATKKIFPFRSTQERIKEFSGLFYSLSVKKSYSASNSEVIPVHNSIQSSKMFAPFPSIQEFCVWIFFEAGNTALIDTARFILEYNYSPLKRFAFESIRTLNPAEEYFYSIYVWGSIFLDGLSLISEIDRLRSFEHPEVYHVRNLENHLRCELNAVKRFVEDVEEMSRIRTSSNSKNQ